MRRLIWWFLPGLMAWSHAHAQLQITANIRTPLPPQVSEWQGAPHLITFNIHNPTNKQFPRAYLSFSLYYEGEEILSSVPDVSVLPRIDFPSQGTVFLQADEIGLTASMIRYSPSFLRRAIRTSCLPEGVYRFCLTIHNARGQVIGKTDPCVLFNIRWPTPPRPVSPLDRAVLPAGSLPLFQWQPVMHVPEGLEVNYRLRIAPRYEGQTLREAAEVNPPILDRIVFDPYYQYRSDDPPLDDPRAKEYVWQVEAVRGDGDKMLPLAVCGAMNMKTAIRHFSFGHGVPPDSGGGRDLQLRALWPVEGDTLPWRHPLLTVQFAPYSDDLRGVTFEVELQSASGKLRLTNRRTLRWPRGPMAAQGPGIDSERATIHILNQIDDAGNPLDWASSLRRGQTYRWRATAQFQWKDGRTSTVASGWHHFTMGLRQPRRHHPAEDARYPTGTRVRLQWQTPPPRALTITPEDLISIRRGTSSMHFPWARERIRLVVSQSPRFDSVLFSHIISAPATGICRMGDACTDLFSAREWQTPPITAEGTYYWQVQYLNDAGITAYARGPVWRFHVVADSLPAGCLSAEAAAPIGRIRHNKPAFKIYLRPAIRREDVRRLRLRIWKKDSNESESTVLRKTPVIETTLTDTADLQFSDRPGGTLVTFRATDNDDDTFEAASGNVGYIWQATVEVAPDAIRRDGRLCDSTRVSTRPVLFWYGPDPTRCQGCRDASLPTHRIPARQRIRAGDTLRIGHFRLIVDRARGRPQNLSGQGRIPLRFFSLMPEVYLEVEFDGLKVNADGVVYEGVVKGRHTSTPLGDRISNWLERGDSLAQSEIRNLHRWMADNPDQQISERTAALRSFRLPVGIAEEIEGRNVIIGIADASFTPRRATMALTLWMAFPELWGPEQGLGLTATGCLMPEGLGNELLVRLTEDIELGTVTIEGGATTDSGTYVEFYCGGLRVMQLAWRHRISRDVLLPLTAGGEVVTDPSRAVAVRFRTRWEAGRRYGSGWILAGRMPEAALAATPAFKLRGEGGAINVLLDLSPVSNPPSMTFPAGYPDTLQRSDWMGFAIPEASLELPPLFDRPEGPTRVGMRHLIIDNSVSFSLYAHHLLDHMDLAQWGGSLDTLRFSMVRGAVREARASGKIYMPVSDRPLHYLMLLQREDSTDSAVFAIEPRDTLSFPLTDIGRLMLDPTSTIHIQLREWELTRLDANLTGRFALQGQVGGIPGLSLRGIRFERFGWATEVRKSGDGPPTYHHRWNNGTWSLASPSHGMGGFPISIEEITLRGPTLRGSALEAGMGLELSVNLTGNLEGTGSGIAGQTDLSFWGRVGYETATRRLRPSFDRVQLDTIRLNADLGAAQIDGAFSFYSRDATYGNGFRGQVEATISGLANGEAVAQFGSKTEGRSSYRYWYVDAALRFPAGMAAGPIAFYGFGGGAWYHMRVEEKGRCTPPERNVVAGARPGASASCYRFVPTADETMGLKALTVLGAPGDPRSYNGDLTLTASFNTGTGGGFERADLTGDLWIASGGETPLEGLATRGRNRAPLWGNARLSLAYTRSESGERAMVFDGRATMNVAVPRDGCMICGRGDITLHFGPDDWFIWIGRPWSSGSPVTTELRIGDITLASTQSYFQLGSRLDPQPPLPAEVIRITGGAAEQPPRMSGLLGTAGGLAMGQKLDFNTGRLEFLVFYGRLRLLTGYDMTIRRLHRMVECAGISPIGMNGWYGMGQIYAYAAAELGMYVDLLFYEGEVEILECEAGAALQAGMPNPTWMKGAVGGRFSALGGVVEGDVNFRFTLGTECRPPYQGPFTQPLITDISPDDGDRDVDVFAVPQATFLFPINTPFEIEETREEDGQTRTIVHRYRVVPDNMTVYEGDNKALPGRWEPETPHLASLELRDMLRPHTPHRLEVRIHAEEYDFARRRWRRAREDGRNVEEVRTARFITGDGPDKIPPDNIAATLPGRGQRFLPVGNVSEGYIRLRRGMPHLLADTGRALEVLLTPAEGTPITVAAQYHPGTKTVTFPLQTLTPQRIYALQLVSKRKVSLRERMGQVAREGSGQDLTSPMVQRRIRLVSGQDVFMTRRTLPHLRKRAGAHNLYAYYFGTSRYRTLRDKLNALFHNAPASLLLWGNRWVGFSGEIRHPEEWFDRFDLPWGRIAPQGHPVAGRPNLREKLGRRLYSRVYQYYYQPLFRHLLPPSLRNRPPALQNMGILMVSAPLPPLREWEIRRAFSPTSPLQAATALSSGSLFAPRNSSVGLNLPGDSGASYAFSSPVFLAAAMDFQTLIRHFSRALREDEFIRIFERQTGHAWSATNRLITTIPIPGVSPSAPAIRDHLGHIHTMGNGGDLPTLSPEDFPRRLTGKLSRRERRTLLRIIRRQHQPLLTRNDWQRDPTIRFDVWYNVRPAGPMIFELNLPE